jgi:hypothetical protein
MYNAGTGSIASYPGGVGPDIDVEMYWDGNLRVSRLPDGTEIRKNRGDGQRSFEVVDVFLREQRGMTEFTLSFREVPPPPKTLCRR